MGVSLLGQLGQYPQTYDAIIGYLRDVAPDATRGALDATLRNAFAARVLRRPRSRSARSSRFMEATGVLEASRRAMNVSFEVQGGRGLLPAQEDRPDLEPSPRVARPADIDLVFVGGDFAADLLASSASGLPPRKSGQSPAGPPPGLRRCSRSPGSTTSLPMSGTVGSRWVTPRRRGGCPALAFGLRGLPLYVSNLGNLNATYGSFATVIVLVFWL